jgi:hypothetical protein
LVEWQPAAMMDPLNVSVGGNRFEGAYHITQRRGRACPCPIWGDHGILGDHKGRPYDDNAVHVVRHDNVGVAFDAGKSLRQDRPYRFNHLAGLIQPQHAVDDFAE